jgi:hypothetical protein
MTILANSLLLWAKEKPSKETLEEMAQRPQQLEFGLFTTRDDKRIFPPKRMAWTGWTVLYQYCFSCRFHRNCHNNWNIIHQNKEWSVAVH